MNDDNDLERDTQDVTDLRMTECNLERVLAPHPMIERKAQPISIVLWLIFIPVVFVLIILVIFYSGHL
jgi:hypothetical protein